MTQNVLHKWNSPCPVLTPLWASPLLESAIALTFSQEWAPSEHKGLLHWDDVLFLYSWLPGRLLESYKADAAENGREHRADGWSQGTPPWPSLGAAVSEINLLSSEISFLLLVCAEKLNYSYLQMRAYAISVLSHISEPAKNRRYWWHLSTVHQKRRKMIKRQ